MILNWIVLIFVGMLVLGFLGGVLGYWYLKYTTLPQTRGRLQLVGLTEAVFVKREPNGIVHIQANNLADLLFAQGVVHAQDRLWQMDFQRRTGTGRVSEILGQSGLEIDKLSRIFGFHRAAETAYSHLSATGKFAVEAYVNGINAYLATNPPLPIEFKWLAYVPELWTPVDVLVWLKVISLQLGLNLDKELQRYCFLAGGLTQERIAQLMPLYPGNDSALFFQEGIPEPNEADKKQAEALLAIIEGLTGVTGGASNNWVLGGSRTNTGKPFLANDPHLPLSIPAIWHLMHLEAPGYNAIGATLPGIPSVIIGRNTQIAWGVTDLSADVQDLYVLQESQDGSGYIYQNQVKPYQIHNEVIHIKGKPSVNLSVRETIYGPVISDLVEKIPDALPLALQWTAFQPVDNTLESFLNINQASNWTEFKAALQHYVVPSQNFVYADVKGNIGYFAAGLLPIRKQKHYGLYPMPGNGDWDWQGFIPFKELPEQFNPEQDYIYTANHNIMPPDYPYTLSLEWAAYPYRARRIEQLIGKRQKHSFTDMQQMQLDTISLLYWDFRPIIYQLTPTSEQGQRWRERLLAWDGNVSMQSQEATVFYTWYIGLTKLLKLETRKEYWYLYPQYFVNAIANNDIACQTLKITCIEYATQVLEKILTQRGKSIPPWGKLHQATFKHPLQNYTLFALFSSRKIPFGGERFTLNMAWYNPKNFAMSEGPCYRQLIDLADMENSRYIQIMGQSGHLLSSQYDNMLEPWQKGEYFRMQTKNYPIANTLTLEP